MTIKIENSDHVSSTENTNNLSNSGNANTQEYNKRVINSKTQYISDDLHIKREYINDDEGYDYDQRELAPIIFKEKTSLFHRIVKGALDVAEVVGGVALAIGSGGALAGAGIALAANGAKNIYGDIANDGTSQSIGKDIFQAGIYAGVGALGAAAGGAIFGKAGGSAANAASGTSSSGAVWV